jgi:UDP-N-acetyl-2-amino-2-deoxyglucuronate dehydrogenase
MAGFLRLDKADVRWFLSVNRSDLPAQAAGKPTYRSISVDDREIEFSQTFADLHTLVYRDILSGGGFGIREVRPSINLVHTIRYSSVQQADSGHRHPLLSREIRRSTPNTLGKKEYKGMPEPGNLFRTSAVLWTTARRLEAGRKYGTSVT